MTQVLNSPVIQKLREQETTASISRDPRGDAERRYSGGRSMSKSSASIASLAGDVRAARERNTILRKSHESFECRAGRHGRCTRPT